RGGVEQGAHGGGDGKEQGKQLEPVEQPAEIGGEQDVPLLAGEAAIPWLRHGDGVGHWHPRLLADQPASVSRNRDAPQPRGFVVIFLPTSLMLPERAGALIAHITR